MTAEDLQGRDGVTASLDSRDKEHHGNSSHFDDNERKLVGSPNTHVVHASDVHERVRFM